MGKKRAIPLTLTGCGVLLLLGIQGLRVAAKTPTVLAVAAESPGLRNALLVGAAMSIGNVWNVVYWGGTGGAVAGSLGTDNPTLATAVFLGAFMLSSVAWCFICAGLIAGVRRALKPRLTRLVDAGSAVALILMAVILATTALTQP